MCLGWEPRMHNAPVKNEEAFIPIAFPGTSTLIITICCFFFFFLKFFLLKRNLNSGLGLSAAEVVYGTDGTAGYLSGL